MTPKQERWLSYFLMAIGALMSGVGIYEEHGQLTLISITVFAFGVRIYCESAERSRHDNDRN